MVAGNIKDKTNSFGCDSCDSYVYQDMGVGGDCYECRNKESPYWSKHDKERWGGIPLTLEQESKGCCEHSLKKSLEE